MIQNEIYLEKGHILEFHCIFSYFLTKQARPIRIINLELVGTLEVMSILSFLQMRKLRLTEVKWLLQGHIATK